jgi:putative hemolysin
MDDGSGHTGVIGVRTDHWRRLVARTLVRWVARLLGESPSAHLSEAQLRDLVARSTVLDGDERQLIDDVLAAGDRQVRELLVPRTEVLFLDAAASVAEAAEVAAASRHSRFPVMDVDRDDVIGFVHLRDLLIRPDGDAMVPVGTLARELRRMPATKRLLAALSEMRRAGDQLALVVDEYGGTAGIVTLEDLIEELVGEIHDEYDAAPEAMDGRAPAEVDGLLNLADFAERTGLVLPAGPYATVGGFIMAALGRLPTIGDEVVVPVEPGHWRLGVSDMDRRRVARVALTFVPPMAVPAPAVSEESTSDTEERSEAVAYA